MTMNSPVKRQLQRATVKGPVSRPISIPVRCPRIGFGYSWLTMRLVVSTWSRFRTGSSARNGVEAEAGDGWSYRPRASCQERFWFGVAGLSGGSPIGTGLKMAMCCRTAKQGGWRLSIGKRLACWLVNSNGELLITKEYRWCLGALSHGFAGQGNSMLPYISVVFYKQQ